MSTSLATRLRRARKLKGFGVNELAAKCYMDGSVVSRLEHGQKNVALIHLRRLAKALGVTIDELVVGPLAVGGSEDELDTEVGAA